MGIPPPPPPPSTPPPAPPLQQRRLVRDPYSRLGGVASGVAHYYGLDVSLVRILFVVFAFATGFGFPLYLVAWLVIPRATHWPPAGPPQPLRSLSGRDLGLVLALVGVLFIFGVGSNGLAGSVLLPIFLVGGGVWLLSQHPQSPSPVGPGSAAPAGSAVAQPGPATADGDGLSEAAQAANLGVDDDPIAATSVGHDGSFASPGPIGPPVAPRSRRRFGVIVAVGLFVLAVPVVVIGGVVAGVATGAIDFDFTDSPVQLTPETVAEIPTSIVRGGAEIEIDLTSLDATDFADLEEPVPLEVRVDAGSIRMIVPDELDVSVDAKADIGSVSVFGQSDEGFGADQRVSPPGPVDIALDLEVDVGEIIVERP